MPFNLPRRLLKLFNTSRHQNGETLPVELWYHIASMVEETADLSRLYRTSRTLQAICQQDLYESIRIYIEAGNQRSINSLLRAMQNPRLADLVTYFYVHIAKIDPHGPEVCDRLDKVVGGLVAPMRNLQELACVCKMRCQHFDTHHLYFQRLETKVLKKLYLGGECFHRTTSKILSTPCMRGITSLILAYKTIRNLNPEEQALVEDDSFLPCLRELSSPTFRPFMTHIRKGSLTSIGIHSNTCDLSTAFSNSLPGAMHLVHLGVESLLPSIMNNPSPFLKLRTMSRFTFNHVRNPWEIVAALKELSCLPFLSCIGISILHRCSWFSNNSLQYSDGGNLALIQDIRQELCKISKVYIDGGNYGENTRLFQIWELVNDVWQSKKVDQHTYVSGERSEHRETLRLE